MPPSLKYAVVERERRFLVRDIPSGVREAREIVDRYLIDTRLRLREVVAGDGTVTRKLGQKIRLAGGAAEIAHTSLYLDDGEWTLLCLLPAMVLRKTRHVVERDDLRVVVDELPDGTLLAEMDEGEQPSRVVPAWLDVLQDVSGDEHWTGARIAERMGKPAGRSPTEGPAIHLDVYGGAVTRTNIDLDDELVAAVMKRYRLDSKRRAVDFALRQLVVEPLYREQVLGMRGSGIEFSNDEVEGGWTSAE